MNMTRRVADFVKFMDMAVKAYPDQRLCAVMGNLNTLKGKASVEWVKKHANGRLYYASTHASWAILVECLFSILTGQGLQ